MYLCLNFGMRDKTNYNEKYNTHYLIEQLCFSLVWYECRGLISSKLIRSTHSLVPSKVPVAANYIHLYLPLAPEEHFNFHDIFFIGFLCHTEYWFLEYFSHAL